MRQQARPQLAAVGLGLLIPSTVDADYAAAMATRPLAPVPAAWSQAIQQRIAEDEAAWNAPVFSYSAFAEWLKKYRTELIYAAVALAAVQLMRSRKR